jgi:hypothetical protein
LGLVDGIGAKVNLYRCWSSRPGQTRP